MTNKEQLKELVDLFRENIDRYKTMSYDESNTRSDFIDKFFILLGWDVLNNKGYSEDYREVVREDKVRIEGKTKAPDYSFRLDGNRKFFVEAKKPVVNIQEERDPAYQVRRYGYSAGCSISILTDFEEFAIYDTRIKPNPNDTAKIARIFYCTYEDYEEKFDELAACFSPEGIRKGSFDKYIKADKKGTGTVDTDFLQTLSEWRLELAEAVAKKNKELDEIDLNHIVQKILNRIVFLRFAEDRGTTEYGLLQRLLAVKKDFYNQLIIIFDEARTRYNSDLFSRDDKLNIVLEDRVIKDIISNLYYPNCPYEFNVIPIELLGTIYERFLGDTITLDGKGKAKVEEKPETRKAGGVYYTPNYIVDYIVENTVGKLLEGKKPEDISEVTIVDPACGSGSFLIGVYSYLLNWYLEKYQAEKKYKKLLCADGTKLILQEKKDILTRHIYGVDLDSQAVEVSKLSLLLKLMEDEGAMDSAGLSFTYLPNLENNIKAGNSLVGKDYLDTIEVSLFDKREQHKIKVFDWKEEFPNVFKNGGFNAVVGNPPYGAELGDTVNYCKKRYNSKNSDTAVLFMYQMQKLLKKNKGIGSFIIPKPFLYASNWQQIVADTIEHLTHVIDCGKVWKEVKLEQCIFVYNNMHKQKYYTSGVRMDKTISESVQVDKSDADIFQVILTGLTDSELALGKKIKSFPNVLNNFISNSRGNIIQKIFDEKGIYPVWGGAHISRYAFNRKNKDIKGMISQSTSNRNQKSIVSKDSILVQNIIAHVQNPYPRLVIGAIPSELCPNNIVIDDTINQLVNTSPYDKLYLLGILNSKLVAWYMYRFIFGNAVRTMHFDNVITSRIPIPKLDLAKKKDKTLHDTLVEKVTLMLVLHKEASAPSQNNSTKLQIQALDRQIDNLVYEMYGLTDDEIRVIEGSEEWY